MMFLFLFSFVFHQFYAVGIYLLSIKSCKSLIKLFMKSCKVSYIKNIKEFAVMSIHIAYTLSIEK